jgi:hypothetical protein
MESIEGLGHLKWNHTAAIYMLLFPLSCPPDGVYRGDGPPWMELRLKPRTAAMDGMGIYRRYCNILFNNNIWSFYNINDVIFISFVL